MRQETHSWDDVRVTAEIVSAGVGQTGLSPTVTVQRIDTGEYLNNGGTLWVPGGPAPTNPMVEVDATDLPGLYEFDVPLARLTEVGAGGPGFFVAIVETTQPVREYVKIETEVSATAELSAAAVTDVVNGVWDEDLVSHSGPPATKAGQLVQDIASLPDANDVADQVWEEDLSEHSGTGGSTAEALAAAGTVDAATIAGEVWSTDLATYAIVVGSTAEALDNISAGASPAQIAEAVWDTLKASHVDTDTFGGAMQVILGMVQGNHRIKNPTYDAEGRLLTATLAAYATPADADADSPLSEFNVTCTYDVDGNLETLLSKE